MNMWLIAGFFLLLGLLPCAFVILSAPVLDRLIALQMAGLVSTFALMVFSQGFGQPSFFDLSLATALLSIPGCLVFCHFLESWL